MYQKVRSHFNCSSLCITKQVSWCEKTICLGFDPVYVQSPAVNAVGYSESKYIFARYTEEYIPRIHDSHHI